MNKVNINNVIYALIREEEIVYIGQTNNYMLRIGQHIKESIKQFDSYKIIEEFTSETKKQINLSEKKYIKKYNPVFNIQHNSSKKNTKSYREDYAYIKTSKNVSKYKGEYLTDKEKRAKELKRKRFLNSIA